MKFEEICINENLNKKFKDEKGLIWSVANIDNYGLTLVDDNKGLITNKYSVLDVIYLNFKEYEEYEEPFVKEGQWYYFISSTFDVESTWFDNSNKDNKLLECGNLYPYTDENKNEVYDKVKLIADKRKLQSQVGQFAIIENNKHKIDWNNGYFNKFYLYINHDENIVMSNSSSYCEHFNSIYFESKEIAKKAIDKFGDEILRLYL